MNFKDYYKILGVERNAGADDVKQAYRRLARKYHPDVSKESNAKEKFQEVNEAYEVLKDKEKRAAYDQLGQYRSGESFHPPPDWEAQYWRGASNADFTHMDFADLFEQIFGGSAGFTHKGARGFKGQDVEATVEISLEQAFQGTEMTLQIQLPELTSQGYIMKSPKAVKVRIPKGAIDGQKLRVRGKGGPGINEGGNGDLYLYIKIKPHNLFKLKRYDLYLDLPVTPWEAALGADVDVPTINSKVKLKIKPGTKSGQRLRIPDKGLSRPEGGFGDFYAVIRIANPDTLSEKEQALYQQLQSTSSFNPREAINKFAKKVA